MEELTRIREELGWSQQRLADESGVNKATINQVERGRRSPNIETLVKLAKALGVELGDFFPKAQTSLPFDETSEQRRSIPDALESYMESRAEEHEQDLKDPNSPHFRTATTATLWVEMVRSEAKTWSEWAIQESYVLIPDNGNGKVELFDKQVWRNAFKVLGHLLTFNIICERAEKRISAMKDKPDELASKRYERTKQAAQESERKLKDIQEAAYG